jgi:hypothetical protein
VVTDKIFRLGLPENKEREERNIQITMAIPSKERPKQCSSLFEA